MVMSHGRIMKIVDAQSVTKEDLGLMMLGGTVDGKEAHYA